MILEPFCGQILFGILFGLTMISSWAGYGWLLGKLLRVADKGLFEDLGIYAGWGLSFWIFVGGVLEFFSAISSLSILVLLIGGLIPASVGLIHNRIKTPQGLSPAWILILVAAFCGYGLHVLNRLYSPADDFVAYSVIPYQMLETGTCLQPYSWRRECTYGGESFLQAATISVLPPEYLNLFDRSCCPLLIFIILANRIWQKRLQNRAGSLSLLVVALILPNPAMNSAPQESTLFLTLVLAFTYEKLLDKKAVGNIQDLLLLGLVSAAYLTLKSQMIVCFGAFFGFIGMVQLYQGRKISLLVTELLGISCFGALFLFPWAYEQYQSSGTFLYPLFKGNQPSDFAPVNITRPLLWTIRWTIWYSWDCKAVTVAFFCCAFLFDHTKRKIGLCLTAAAVLHFIIFSYCLAGKIGGDIPLYRYSFGLLVGAAFWCIISRLEEVEQSSHAKPPFVSILGTLLPLALFFLIFGDLRMTLNDLFQVGTRGDIMFYPGPWTPQFVEYRSMQYRVPPGEPILVFTNYPFLFDFARNPILIGDIPGACSPPPHMPMFQGIDRLKSYLIADHVHFIIHSDFTQPGYFRSGIYTFYSMPMWQDLSKSPAEVWAKHGAYFVDIMKNLMHLEQTQQSLKDNEDLTCVNLLESSQSR